MAAITQKKTMGLNFHRGPLQKKKNSNKKSKTKLNGVLTLKKACSRTIVKVFVIITIIKTDYNDNSK